MTYASPLLTLPGSVEGGGADAGVAAHYGDPFREQRELSQGRAVVDLSHQGVVTVSGPDRLSWLNSLTSQLLLNLEPGRGAETLLLTVQGRIEYGARLLDDGETTWLIVEGSEAHGLAGWLQRMKFMLRVEIADASAEWAVVGSVGPVAGLADYAVWVDPWPGITAGGFPYSTVQEDLHPGHERPWSEYLVPRDSLYTAVTSLEDHQPAGTMASEALRVAAWRPRMGFETDDKAIPHELDLLRSAVHLAKGCYKGQETVARVHNLGHPPRRLVFLHLDGSEHTLPKEGSAVVLDGRTVGRVTSVAHHWEMGPIALAVIKRSVDPAATLVVHDDGELYAAAQEIIVAPDAGQVVGRATGFLKGPR